jgi:sugar phosphate isomerase/epimerase
MNVRYSLSTMWAQQERFDDMRDFARIAEELGYDAIEISHSTPEDRFERLMSGITSATQKGGPRTGEGGLPISSIHAPAPRRDVSGKFNSSLNLAAEEVEERNIAIEHTKHSIEHAATAGAPFVVVHLGGVGNRMFEAELKMRRLFDSGTRPDGRQSGRGGDEFESLRRETLERRVELAPPYFERARETLAELAAFARERGVAIGLENRLHHHEIPLPHEALELLADYSPELVGYWHDVGHAEVQARLGYVDKRAWLDTLSARTIGCHLHDVEGIGDHRACGTGDVEWDYLASGLPPTAVRVFEINQTFPEEAVAASIAFLRERGVVS